MRCLSNPSFKLENRYQQPSRLVTCVCVQQTDLGAESYHRTLKRFFLDGKAARSTLNTLMRALKVAEEADARDEILYATGEKEGPARHAMAKAYDAGKDLSIKSFTVVTETDAIPVGSALAQVASASVHDVAYDVCVMRREKPCQQLCSEFNVCSKCSSCNCVLGLRNLFCKHSAAVARKYRPIVMRSKLSKPAASLRIPTLSAERGKIQGASRNIRSDAAQLNKSADQTYQTS